MPGDYRVRAQIAPRMSSGNTPDEGIPLVPSGTVPPDHAGTVLELRAPAGTRLADFSELLTEYGDRRSCHADWSAVLRTGLPGDSARTVHLAGKGVMASDAVIMAEEPVRMEWARKDYGYLIRRALGMAPDTRWRYAQDGGFTIIQRRLEVPLRNAHTIELEFPGKTVLSGVNLSIAKGPGRRAHQLLLGDEFSSRTVDDGSRTRVSLYLDDTLADRTRWGDDPYLAEIIVSYQGGEAEVARDKPLRSMRVLGDAPQAGISPPPDGGENWVDEASGKRLTRQRFSLKGLDNASGANGGTELAAVVLHLPPGCGSRIARARLIKPHNAQAEPLFQTSVRRQLERLGGPFLHADAASQEWMHWVEWLPFSEAQPELRRSAESDSEAELPGWRVRLQWRGTDSRMAMSKEGLVGTGISHVRLQWDMDAIARPGLLIFAGLPTGAQPMGTLDAELRLESGNVERFQLAPNRAQLLPSSIPTGSRIRSLTLQTVAAPGVPQAWTLASLGIFHPYLVPRAHLAGQPRPGWRLLSQPLVPRAHTPADGTYRWESQPSGVRAGDLLQIRVAHTPDLRPAEACWLSMEAHGERGGQVRIPLCPTTADWQTGLGGMLHAGGLALDETIQKLSWTARLSALPPDGSLRVALGVNARPSVNETLLHGLLLQPVLGAPPLLPVPDSPKPDTANPAPLWLDYGSQTVSSGQAPSDAPWQDDDLFELQRVTWVADPALWPALEEQRKLRLRQSTTAAPHPEAGLRLQSAWLILFASVVFLATVRSAVARRAAPGRIRPIHAWANVVGDRIHRASACLRVHLPSAAPVYTAVATGLTLFWMWMGGHREAEAPLFLAAGLLALLAVCVRLSRMAPRLPHSRSPVRAIVAVLWLAAVAWLLGSSAERPKQSLAYASLAVAFLIWTGLPMKPASRALRKIGGLAAKTGTLLWGLTTVLILCSIGLYALGLSIPPVGRRENVWITMAAIVTVAVWWRAAQSVLPALKHRSPDWASTLYEVPGGGLFAGALLVLALSCVALWLGRSTLAAHLSTLCFYLWCTGALVTAFSPWAPPATGRAP